MNGDTALISVAGTRNPSGWRLDLEINEVVENVCTLEEQALLLEKLACVASNRAARIRQNISSNLTDDC